MTHSILLVDDDPLILQSLAREMRKEPFHIYTARSAEEAFLVIKTQEIDLIVSDEKMPGKSGTKLLTWMSKYFPDVVRIILSGQLSVPTAMRAINEARVFRFFEKPCDVAQLILGIRDGLKQKDSSEQQPSSVPAKAHVTETGISDINNASTKSSSHILLVDDSPTILAKVTDFLESIGYATVTAVSTGAEALKQFNPDTTNILIVDYEMPGMNGLAVMEAVHKQSPSTPVIFLTGCIDPDLVVKLMRAGAVDYLTKDQSYTELKHALQRATRLVEQADALKREEEARRQAETELRKLNERLQFEVRAQTAMLIEKEARIRTIVETAADGIIIIDERGIIETFNNAAEELFGYAADYVVGRNISTLMPASYAEKHDEHITRYLHTNRNTIVGTSREVPGRRKDGTEFPLQLAVSEVKLDNRRFFTGIVRDLTDQKRIEQDLIDAKHAAEAANHTKSEFLANMSHELRTPLHGILSFARFGIQKHASAAPEKLLDFFRRIENSGTTLLDLLNDVLDLSKLEAGKMTFTPTAVDIVLLVDSVVDEFSSQCHERNLTIRFDKPSENIQVLMDQGRIKQVMRNLLSNTVKFSPEGGTVEVSLYHSDDLIKVSISDKGSGIPEGELQAVFGEFVQSSKTKTGAGGTGLGLSICRQIIDAHNGRIWAEHNLGGGAIFSFELPVDRLLEGESNRRQVAVEV